MATPFTINSKNNSSFLVFLRSSMSKSSTKATFIQPGTFSNFYILNSIWMKKSQRASFQNRFWLLLQLWQVQSLLWVRSLPPSNNRKVGKEEKLANVTGTEVVNSTVVSNWDNLGTMLVTPATGMEPQVLPAEVLVKIRAATVTRESANSCLVSTATRTTTHKTGVL